MTTSFTISDKGFREMAKKLNSLQQLRAVRPTIKAVTLELKGHVAKYPSHAGRKHNKGPYPAKWYERGWGSAWALAGGGYHRAKTPTSETLGKRWGIKMEHGGLTGVIGTNVSYARYVQDEARRPAFMAKIGWPSVQSVAKDHGPGAIRTISAAIARVLAGKGIT